MSDEPRSVSATPDTRETARSLPTWFVAALVATMVWCATAGAAGIGLLGYGKYNATLVGTLATFAAFVAAFAAARRLGPRPRADNVAAIAAVALVVAFFLLSSAFHSEHFLRDRDPAIYLTSGRSIARFHELRPKTHVGPFASPAFGSPATRYLANFFPMLPVLLALAWSIGGDSAMLLVGPALGALGLLACFALASRLVGPRWALGALVLLMITAPQIWFSRDAFSELVVQVVVLGGLWLYLEARARVQWGFAALSGALVASSALARIDSLAILVGTLVLITVEWARCDSDAEPVRARRVVAAFGGALIGATGIALVLTRKVAYGYIHSLGDEYRQLVAAAVAAMVGLIAVVLIHRLRPGIGRWFNERKLLFAAAVAGATGVFVWAYVWRPAPVSDMPLVTPGRPTTAALRTALNEWHFTASLHWFSAYYGLVGLVLAFVGFVVLAAGARRGNAAAATVFLVVVPVAVMYIARPSIQAGQPWAMRRYLPVVLPGIAIAVVFALERGWRSARVSRRSVARAAATFGVVIVGLSATVPTAYAALPFVTARAQHGAESAVHHICEVAGDDSALLVAHGGYLNNELPDAVRMFCGIPTANAPGIDLLQTAREWHDAGRRFLVATVAPRAILNVVTGSKVVGHYLVSDDADPERVYERAPRRFSPVPVDIWILEIPPNKS